MSSIYDGGPMITAGVVIARDPELGINSGIYRFIVKEKNLTGIDIVTPNNMRMFAQRAFERGEPLPISISIGTHPIEITGSGYRAPLGVDEMAIAGGIRGAPVELAPCQTIDMPYIADAEIVLEAEILPTGWTLPEGRFGEFTRLMGGLHWNPLVRIKAISMRKDAIYYNLHMPWENTWLAAPTRYSAIRTALRTAGVQVKDINVTLGGCAFWHAVISIKKQPGEAKNALLAALSVMDLKHVVVVDDDIDVYDPMDVEWAIATRVQGDKDVMIVSNARAKPLDPSLPQGAGMVPTGAKVGIDATIPDGIPKEHYERITYAYADKAKIDDYVKGKADEEGEAGDEPAVAALAGKILQTYRARSRSITPTSPSDSLTYDFRTVARAIGHLHATEKLWQDPRGRMCVRGSEFAAKPPAEVAWPPFSTRACDAGRTLCAGRTGMAADKVRVGKAVAHVYMFSPVNDGVAAGIFARHGIDVEIINFGGAPKLHQGMAADSIDIGIGSGPDIAFIAKGAPELAVATIVFKPSALGAVVAPGFTDKIL